MSFIDGLGTYQNQAHNQVRNQKTGTRTNQANTKKYRNQTNKTNQASRTNTAGNVKLSNKAKALLEELKAKYADTDFMVADYSNDEEAQQYLSQGTKAFSVLIDPEDLEAMANDEQVKNKTLSLLDDARKNLTSLQDQLEEDGETHVKNLGVTIGTDGKVSYFAELEKMSQNQKERIERIRENKAEEKAEADKQKQEERMDAVKADRFHTNLPQIDKHTTVQADSIEELLEKIRNVNWDEIPEENAAPMGRRFDLNI